MMKKVGVYFIFAGMLLTACGGGGSSAPVVTPPAATDPDPVVTVDADGNTSFDSTTLAAQLDAMSLGELNQEETDGLLLMREEEKLARDVYLALYEIHGLTIFNNISSSEQTHTDAVLALLDRYSLTDPVGENAIGMFENVDLQQLHDALVARGTNSLLDALFVGAEIEELDIADIENLKLQVLGNDDIVLVYDNLLKGSRNHLRSFYRQIESNGGTYTPTHISQTQFDEIVNGDMERG